MNKKEFLKRLRKGLSGLPKDDMEERLTFYKEMIDDRIEDGLSEEEAVAEVGSVDEIVSQIAKPQKRLKAWEIVLLVLGSPIWLSLLIAALAVLWSVTISLWAIFISLVGCTFGGIVAGIICICRGDVLAGIALIGVGIVCIGLSIFMFYGCKAVTKGSATLTKAMFGRGKRHE